MVAQMGEKKADLMVVAMVSMKAADWAERWATSKVAPTDERMVGQKAAVSVSSRVVL